MSSLKNLKQRKKQITETNDMKLICKREPLMPDGTKAMEFTKGKEYWVFEEEDVEMGEYVPCYVVMDDKGKPVRFFTLNIIFEKL